MTSGSTAVAGVVLEGTDEKSGEGEAASEQVLSINEEWEAEIGQLSQSKSERS